MADQIHTPLAPPPTILSGEEVYELIMGKIEPELTESQRPNLDEKYKNEMPEDNKTRLARYQKAFEQYDIDYKAYMEALEDSVRRYQTALRKDVEHDATLDDEVGLTSIESQLFSI